VAVTVGRQPDLRSRLPGPPRRPGPAVPPRPAVSRLAGRRSRRTARAAWDSLSRSESARSGPQWVSR
jgi:hypothetical protein